LSRIKSIKNVLKIDRIIHKIVIISWKDDLKFFYQIWCEKPNFILKLNIKIKYSNAQLNAKIP